MQQLSYLDSNWVLTAEVSPPLCITMTEIKLANLLTGLRVQTACLASNQCWDVVAQWLFEIQLAWWHGDVCKVFGHERAWFRLSSAIICWGESDKVSGNLATVHTHCTVMITFIVPIDFLMTLWLVIFSSNLQEKTLAVHLKVMISVLLPRLSFFALPSSTHSHFFHTDRWEFLRN